MRLRDPFNSRSDTVQWNANAGCLRDYRDWGHVTEKGMIVISTSFSGKPTLQVQAERELGLLVFNGVNRPSSLRAWDVQGNPVQWTELSNVWMVWDREHDIILPEPSWRTHRIVYPHPLGRPYISQCPYVTTREHDGVVGGFKLSGANRKRGNEWVEFFKLIVMKGRLAGPPERHVISGLSILYDVLPHCPNLEAVPIDTCQKIVYGLNLQDRIPDAAITYVRQAARDKWYTPYLSTWSRGRES